MSKVTRFTEYAVSCGVEIKVFDDEDSKQEYVSKDVLESWLCIDPKKEREFIFDRLDHHLVHGYADEFVKVEKAVDVIELLRSHPLQYNCQLAIKGLYVIDAYVIDDDLLKKYKKKEETYTMAAIYAKYGEKFRIFPQYNLLGGTYRTDGFLSLLQENIPGMYVTDEDKEAGEVYPGGILLEIDEKDHANYDPEDEVSRHNIIKTHRYSLVRTKTGDDFKRLCIKIESAKHEQQLVYTSNIDPEKIWEELQNHCVEADFFKLFKKCLNPNEKYCISSQEVADYVGQRHDHMKRNIQKGMTDHPDEYSTQSRSPLVGSDFNKKQGASGNGGLNKKLIYMTVTGMQLAMMRLRGNVKARQAQLSLITCYKVAFKVALALKQKVTSMIAKTKTHAFDALEEMNAKESRKHKKAKAKIKFVDQKKEEEIEVHIDKIMEMEEKAKNREKTLKLLQKRVKKLEEQEEEYKKEQEKMCLKIEKYKKRITKYMNRCREVTTELETCKKERKEFESKLKKYEVKADASPDTEKYKKKVKKYVKMVNEKITENNKLKSLLKKYKGKVKSKDVESDKESAEDAPVVSVVGVVGKYTQKSLSVKSVRELKDLCRSKGIGGYSALKKADLVTFMLNSPKLK